MVLNFICLFFQIEDAHCQTNEYFSYTTKDGLPSNNVYKIIEDNNGFLWISTDAGVTRFDGKNFQIFTTQQGLPDNDIFYMEKENDGRIWVSSYKQQPAYFDEVENRFITPVDKKTLEWFGDFNSISPNLAPFPLKNGGMYFGNKERYLIFKDGKLVQSGERTGKWKGASIEEFENDASLVCLGDDNKKINQYELKLIYYQGTIEKESILLYKGLIGRVKGGYVNDGKVYLCSAQKKSNECIILSNIQIQPIIFKKDTIKLPSPAINLMFTEKSFYFTTYSGEIYVYNKGDLKLKQVIKGNFIPNGYGEDSNGNQYISTVDKGILVYRKNKLDQINLPEDFHNLNFLSIISRNDATIFAGNYHGEIVEWNKNKTTIHETNKIVTSKIRKILFSGNDIYTFSEQGIYKNYGQKLFLDVRGYSNVSFAKTAATFNDSILLIGTHVNLLELNTHTMKPRELVPGDLESVIRITAIEKADGNSFYFGSVNGLFKYDYNKEKYKSLAPIDTLLKDRISALNYTKDGFLCVSTSSNNLLFLKNDKLILNIPNQNPAGVIRNIFSEKPGQLWVSTSNGINIIDYEYSNSTLKYSIRNLTINDGLLSNDVREITYNAGKYYASTSNGISIIPENYSVPQPEIPVYLTQIQINQKDAEILNDYDLKYGEQEIQMQFSAVNLNGYFNYFQYKLDDAGWADLKGNLLTIHLGTGEHQLKLRAVDSNGNISQKILTLRFNIAIPFWQKIWFWISLGILFQIILYFLINHFLKRKKERELNRKSAELQTAALEQQAFTSLMNPHFIFNALNSIQHYINIQDRKSANRYLSDFASLIRKNFNAAQQSFISLEEEIENIQKYLELEKMRFDGKVQYEIQIAENLDPEDWMVPTMILQPILENAVLHGIMPSKIPGEITIRFKLETQDLLITVTDNGIGILNSENLKTGKLHQSRGMELIRKRISALSYFGTKPMTISLKPAFNSTINPGNKVMLLIPNDLYDFWRKSRN